MATTTEKADSDCKERAELLCHILHSPQRIIDLKQSNTSVHFSAVRLHTHSLEGSWVRL